MKKFKITKHFFIHFLSFIIFFENSCQSQSCIGDIYEGTCYECDFNSYLSTGLFQADLINSTTDCSPKNITDIVYDQQYYVSNSTCLNSNECLGNKTFPFDSFIKALNQIHLRDLAGKYQTQIIKLYLLGSPHYILNSDLTFFGTRYFRRMNATVNISPWFCEDGIIDGCVYKSMGQKIDIIIKTFGFNFEIYGNFTIENINFIGNDIILKNNSVKSCYNQKTICCDDISMNSTFVQDECGLNSFPMNITAKNQLKKLKGLFQLRLLYNEDMSLNASLLETPVPTLNLVNITISNFYSVSDDDDSWLNLICFGTLGYILNIDNVIFKNNFFPLGFLYFSVLEEDPYYKYLSNLKITAIYLKYPSSKLYNSTILINALEITEYLEYRILVSAPGNMAPGLISLYEEINPIMNYKFTNILVQNVNVQTPIYFFSFISTLTNQPSFYFSNLIFQNNGLLSMMQTSSCNITFNEIVVDNISIMNSKNIFFLFQVSGFIWFFDCKFTNLNLSPDFMGAKNFGIVFINCSFGLLQNRFAISMINGFINLTHWKFFFANIINNMIFLTSETNVSIIDTQMLDNVQGPDDSSQNLYIFYAKTCNFLVFNILNITINNWIFLNYRASFFYILTEFGGDINNHFPFPNFTFINGDIQNLKFKLKSGTPRLYFFNFRYLYYNQAFFRNISIYNNEAFSLILNLFTFYSMSMIDLAIKNNTCNYYMICLFLQISTSLGDFLFMQNVNIINLYYPYTTIWLIFFNCIQVNMQDSNFKNISHADFYVSYLNDFQQEQFMIFTQNTCNYTVNNSYFESTQECNYNVLQYVNFANALFLNSTFVSFPNSKVAKWSKALWIEFMQIVKLNITDCSFYNFTPFLTYIDWESHTGVVLVTSDGNCYFYSYNNYFFGNFADDYGIFTVDSLFMAEIVNTTIINSQTTQGGGLRISNIIYSNVTLDGVTIIESVSSGKGGSIWINEVYNIIMKNIRIINSTANYGGAIIFENVTYGSLINISIQNTNAFIYGGALYFFKCWNMSLDSSQIINVFSGYGGSIYSDSSSLFINNIEINNSIANNSGGAFYLKSVQETEVLIDIRNSIIVSCYAQLSGVCLYSSQLQSLRISNCQFISSWTTEYSSAGIIELSNYFYFSDIAKYDINQNILENITCLNNVAQVSCFYLSTNLKISLSNSLGSNLTGAFLFLESDGLTNSWQNIEIFNLSVFYSNFIESDFRKKISNALVTISNVFIANIFNFFFQNNFHILNLIDIKYSNVNMSNSTFCNFNSISSNFYLNLIGSNVILIQIEIYYSENYTDQKSAILNVIDSDLSLNNSVFTNVEVNFSAIFSLSSSTTSNKFIFFNTSFIKMGASEAVIYASSINLLLLNCSFKLNRNIDNAFIKDDQTIDLYFYDNLKENILYIFGTNFENEGGANSISILGGFFVNIIASEFLSKKPQEFSNNAIYIDSALSVSISLTKFIAFSSETGSSLKLFKRNFDLPLLMNLLIINCLFENNTAYLGGAIFMRGFIILNVITSNFVGNKAIKSNSYAGDSGIGGCLVSDSEYYSLSQVILNNSSFENNYAERLGPTFLIKNNNFSDLLSGNKFKNNSDLIFFSNAVTSLPIEYFVLSSNFTLDTINKLSFNWTNSEKTNYLIKNVGIDYLIVASGQQFNFSIIMTDYYNQTLYFESTSYAKMSCSLNDKDVLISKESATVSNGIFTFINVTITSKPNITLTELVCSIKISVDDSVLITSTIDSIINSTLNRDVVKNLKIFIRNCLPGEIKMVDNTCRVCAPHTFSLKDPMNEIISATCLPCPSNALCPGGSALQPAGGSWRYSIKSSLILNCPTPEACLGYDYSNSSSIQGICNDDYWGNLCYNCKMGLARSGQDSTCDSCQHIVWIYIKIVLGFIFVVSYTCLQVTVYSKINDMETPTAILLKLFVNHFQILAMISLVNFNWTVDFQIYFSIQEYLSCLYQDFFNIDCLIQSINQDLLSEKIIFEILLPILFSVIMLIIWIIAFLYKVIKDPNNLRASNYFIEKIRTTFIVLIFIFYPEILRKCFILLNCILLDDSNNYSVLRYSPEIQCWSSDHMLWALTISFPGILLWGIITPLIIFFILYKNKTDIQSLMETQTKKDKVIDEQKSHLIIKCTILINIDPFIKEKIFGDIDFPLQNSLTYKSSDHKIIEDFEIDVKSKDKMTEGMNLKPSEITENLKNLINKFNLSEEYFKNEVLIIKDPNDFYAYIEKHKIIQIKNELEVSDLLDNLVIIHKNFELVDLTEKMKKNRKREKLLTSRFSSKTTISQKIPELTPTVFKNLGFIYKGYKKDYYYWEIVLFSRKFFLIMIGVFKEIFPYETQNSNLILVLFYYYFLQMKNEPYAYNYLNKIEFLSLKISLVTALFGILLFADDLKPASIFFLTIIFLINAYFLGLWIYFLSKYGNLKSKWNKIKEGLRKYKK